MNANEVRGRLHGKTALIVGGTSGIGRAIAVRYATEGASTAIAAERHESGDGSQTTDDLIRSDGGVAHYFELDVTDSSAVDRITSEVVSELGGLDILVFSAGVTGGRGDTRDIAAAEFDEHFNVDVRGGFLCAQAALKHFVPKRAGKIVMVSSNFGLVGVGGLAVYCAAKAAVIGLTRAMAVEYGPLGININALCPGATKTTSGDRYREEFGVMDTWRRMTPLRMPGDELLADPDDIAAAALFLATEESRFMTGACLVVDGGWIAQ